METKQESEFDSKALCNEFAAYLDRYVKMTGKKYEFNDQNKTVIKKLVHYFAQDPELEKMGLSARKGIFLFGPVGTGKTTIMTAMNHWVKQRKLNNVFRLVNCRDIQWQFTKSGGEVLEMYGRRSFIYDYHKGLLKDKPIIYCFDDFGAENRAKHFGNDTNVMEEVLQDRYAEGIITHITSNLGKNWDKVEEIYGTRIRSRSREMFNLIELEDVDHRK